MHGATLVRDFAPLLDGVRGLEWPARVQSGAAHAGAQPSRMRGSTGEFEEYRAYRPGDETRHIDWRLLARSDRAYIRIARERAILPTMLVVDATASMAFPAAPPTKYDFAADLAVGLAAVGVSSADPIGLHLVRTGAGPRRPRARRDVPLELALILRRTEPGGTASLPLALREASLSARRLVVLSDFLDDEPAALTTIRGLCAHGVEVHAVHVVAAAELDPVADGVLVHDPENPHLSRPLTHTAVAEYRERFRGWRERLAGDLRTTGAFYIMAIAGTEAPAEVVRRIVSAARAL